MKKILFLPNWNVHFLDQDCYNIQAPDKYVYGKEYWFFKYFPIETEVDIIDINESNFFHFIEKKFKFYFVQAFKAFFVLKKYDVIISHGGQSGLMLSLLISLFRRKVPRHIIIDVGCLNGARENHTLSLIKLALRRNKPDLIYHSSIQENFYKKHFPSLKTKFVPFGVDTDFFKSNEQIDNNDVPYILSFGYEKRDYATLIAAWKEISTSVKLRLIGVQTKGLLEFGSNIDLKSKCSITELMRNIKSAVFIVIPLPVFKYSYGQMSFLQSMSMGKTVIVTKTPSSVDYLEEGNGAFYVSAYNKLELKCRIEYLLNNPTILAQSDQKSREFIIRNFSEKQMGESIYSFLNS